MYINTFKYTPKDVSCQLCNTQKSNTDRSSTHSFFLPAADGMTEGLEKKAEIREQIEYDILCQQYDRMQLDELVEIMLEVAMNRSPTVKIGRDAEYPTGFVQQRFAVLDGGKCILQLRGVRPFLSNKYDLTKHPLYRYTADYDKKYAFDIERFLSHRLKLKPDDAVEVYQADLSGEPVA